ncbi:hypothetical protein [Micromonospora tarensis]|uniref:WD40-like Beta Propeller Repeat n=1 Tax=Micromonospora tarensis TaxID=2806100 RepID=A0ABS1YFB8_9ACTN|nr:hypothetical protein [Micromonospora tarensis]MBM0276111.1 hypothetical protein [Micromonospora tarensis]
METLARIHSGAKAQRLLCHPRLPLVAGWDADRPVIRIWEYADGQLRECGSVGTGSAGYGEDTGYERLERTPSAAWHPAEALLVVADAASTVCWTPSGSSAIDGVAPTEYHREVAFSPDGRTLWLSPASGEDGWEQSVALDLASGTTSIGPQWDTGVVAHPAGGLVCTLQSDQAATLVLFAEDIGPVLRPLLRALVLNCDGYEAPTFSSDGRHFAVRGNAYDNSLDVFEFPSLRRVLSMTLGEPSPGYPYPQEWLDEMNSWSRQNAVFGPLPGVLWIGTPGGAVVELELDGARVTEHEVLPGVAVTALAATATGELVVAGDDGVLLLLSVGQAGPGDAPRAVVTEFLAGTREASVVDMDQLHLTDGTRSWQPGDLDLVSEDSETDPPWLRIRAAMNRLA